LSACFHSCRWAEFGVTLLSSDGKWLTWLQLGLGWASNHAVMHAIGLTLSSLYFNCILGSHLEKLLEAWACSKPILACFRVVSPVESVKFDFYDQYKALVLSVCLLVSKCLLDLDLEMKLIVKYGQAGRLVIRLSPTLNKMCLLNLVVQHWYPGFFFMRKAWYEVDRS